ncbi:glycoside hydrolase family 16 protein [Vibrio sp. JPW-9-11-11]|uniref:glycoside hydrolase family 16 protein n=1 Tax=Vibrio sp. JPW-9-11-11 TaxID=1416532 RepID=UPI001593A54B|nr:glycoside hydrolase family 16 protein [Vibrio sp. JPW-9-11-11]NVD08803.1 glycoside hydrolase family 16 protein [Vibrio sp. JPW-9-11-11]
MNNIRILALASLLPLLLGGCNQSKWELVWSDEFEAHQIDSEKWNHEVNCWGGGNAEQQCYVADEANSFVSKGKLVIRLLKGDTTGPNQVEGSEGYGETTTTLPYSSARLTTMNKGDWKYGRFEIRAKLPQGQGTWPAIWMLPTEWVYGGWAASGEIDIMEAVNLGTHYQVGGVTKPENRVHGTLHYGKAWPNNVYSGEAYDFGDSTVNPADGFHIYAIEWEQDEIRWYVDDVHYATQKSTGWWTHYQDDQGQWVSGANDAPYNQDFHLILNLAMGGSWPTAVNDGGIDPTIEQAEMQVDYVRVYRCRVDPETGKGCATNVSPDAVEHPGVAEPDFPADVDLFSDRLTLFSQGELLHGFNLNGWDDGNNDTRLIDDTGMNISIIDNGNAYIEALGDPLDMSDFSGGEMVFDLSYSSGNASDLLVKMDSGYPALASLTIPLSPLPQAQQWHHYRFAIDDFIAQGSNGFDIASITNLAVFEPVNNSDFSFKVDNIAFIKPVVLLSGDMAEGFQLDGYNPDGDDLLNAVDGGIQAQFNGGGNLFITSNPALDMSEYSNWILKFDIKIVDLGSHSDVLVKMDSGWPNVSDIALSDTTEGLSADGQWHTYSIAISDFVAAENRYSPGDRFDLTSVNNPFVLEGFGGENLSVELANIRFVAK